MKRHYMIDIETTGTNKDTDDILEIGIVPIELDDEGYWEIMWKDNPKDLVSPREFEELHLTLYSPRQPENVFAKEHMAELYERCNKISPEYNYNWAKLKIQEFLHKDEKGPKFFMGWNASNFDVEFLIQKEILEPSRYVEIDGKEVLQGDAHYRVYEQTGALNLVLNFTGFSKKTLFALMGESIPEHIEVELPEGKEHDALYDCYKQINMMNGLIALARRGWSKYER